ncbi:MAG: prepilin-type N-terminal cleavage/methylation domain-containing protein [Deltaproteobacteria bacterium]|nr:prepilin-type N-terminal cleavage/methylation domain-containing protein [Deltaproteobacteria bacterium]
MRTDNIFKKTTRICNSCGLTLFEVIFSIAILGIMMIGLQQALGTALSAYGQTKNNQELLAQARYTMERIAMFVQETDEVQVPSPDKLKVSERILDIYNNSDHSYVAEGDGYLDADNDGDGLVNEDASDPIEFITFSLKTSDPSNWKIEEKRPDYSTPETDDTLEKEVICEHVTDFTCTLLSSNLVEIKLALNDGINEVSLKTRVKAMYIQ